MKVPVKDTNGPSIQYFGGVGGGLPNRIEADVTIHGLPRILSLQKTVPSTPTAMPLIINSPADVYFQQ